MTVLVTGARGMIGSALVKELLAAGYRVVGVDRGPDSFTDDNYRHYEIDLSDKERLIQILHEERVDRVVHLAGLAHKKEQKKLSWEDYYHSNVECSRNVFEAAGDRPLLFISTVDVFGFYDGKQPLTPASPLHPVTAYGMSKAAAETECRKLKHYDIFRFSPVYTDRVKRDIQKRYYLVYPCVAYQIGSGSAFEILNIRKAADEMVCWCTKDPTNRIRIVKDDRLMWTPAYIGRERENGRAKILLWMPKWLAEAGYSILKGLFGENQKTYLMNKALFPIRSTEDL